MKGWIFGKERDAYWTQSIYGNKRRFQNPLRQNYKHVKALEELLKVPAETVHSVIAFVGDAELKTEMPPNVTQGRRFIRYVQQFDETVFTRLQVEVLLERLQDGRLPPTLATHRTHVQNLKNRERNM